MAINLPPINAPQDQPGTKEGYGRNPLGYGMSDCKGKAEQQGGFTWDEHAQACWNIFGKTIIIGNSKNSIMEGFEIVNFNFHTNGNQPAVPGISSLPGPSIGATTGGGSPQGGYGV